MITYLNVSSTLDANGLDVCHYHASADFTLAGRTGTVVIAPLDGQVRVVGDLVKTHTTTDDITIQILKNGTLICTETTIGRDARGTFSVAIDAPVAATDEIQLRLKIDSPVNLAAFSWTPRLYYLSATQDGQPVVVTDDDGNPTLDVNPPVDLTDPTGQVFEHLEHFPSGKTWVLEHSDIHRVPYLYTGGYYDEVRELYNLGARWYEPRGQMFYSTDPVLVISPKHVISDPALLAAYSYAEDNPMRLVDRNGHAPEDVHRAFRAAFGRPDGSLDPAKVRQFATFIQQSADIQSSGSVSRLIAQVVADPKGSAGSVFKAFATFSASRLIQINLTRTPDGLKLKNIKVAPFFFKQFTVKKGSP